MKALVSFLALGAVLLALAGPARAQSDLFMIYCDVMQVQSFPDRVHARCLDPSLNSLQPEPRTVYYFAVPTTDAAAATRFLMLATQALVGRDQGLNFAIQYDRLEDASWFGCAHHNCRHAITFQLY